MSVAHGLLQQSSCQLLHQPFPVGEDLGNGFAPEEPEVLGCGQQRLTAGLCAALPFQLLVEVLVIPVAALGESCCNHPTHSARR